MVFLNLVVNGGIPRQPLDEELQRAVRGGEKSIAGVSGFALTYNVNMSITELLQTKRNKPRSVNPRRLQVSFQTCFCIHSRLSLRGSLFRLFCFVPKPGQSGSAEDSDS